MWGLLKSIASSYVEGTVTKNNDSGPYVSRHDPTHRDFVDSGIPTEEEAAATMEMLRNSPYGCGGTVEGHESLRRYGRINVSQKEKDEWVPPKHINRVDY